ncbi:MAG: 50S ribosomal protein L5 [Candidatus Verstraetearchaeota archaeon]|jgi:large subunit ribosomal protein L5|nr:50S ribosomal protein L5 [Candidatus Culexarchaeum yellowstonense]MCS7367979.1 50S ribosomal protein L5 [Candidatus Culexarchaeum yellowstonense]NHV11782.1 50S ribosomal protein L5 [Candidatus Verstraetearchaeota archaeon]
MSNLNPMQRIMIDKVVVNMSVGPGEKLEKAVKVLEELTGQKPCKRRAKKTIREFGIRRGEEIACITTLRGNRAKEFLQKVLVAKGNTIKKESFDKHGNISFGIKEHLDIPGTKYDPNLGIFGMDVTIVFKKPGYRVAVRRRKRSKVGGAQKVKIDEAIEYLKSNFGVEIVEG